MTSSPLPNPNPGSTGLGSDSVSVAGVTRRRSLRLASKSDCGSGEVGSVSGTESVRSRKKPVSGEKGACLSEDKGGVFVENGEMGLDLIGKLDMGFGGLSGKGSGLEAGKSERKEEEGLRGFGEDGLKRKLSIDLNLVSSEEEGLRGFGEVGLGSNLEIGVLKIGDEAKRKRRLSIDLNVVGLEYVAEDEESKGYLSLRSGKRVVKKGMGGGDGSVGEVEEEGGEGLGRELIDVETGCIIHERRLRRAEKGKGKLVQDDLMEIDGVEVVELSLECKAGSLSDNVVEHDVSELNNGGQGSGGNEKGKRKLGGASDEGIDGNGGVKSRRRYSKEEKGKGKLADNSLKPNGDEKVELALDSEVKNSVEDVVSSHIPSVDNVALLDETNIGKAKTRESESSRRNYMERFREIARENASRFALYSSEEEENNVSTEAEAEPEIEDWPGPFSTAMKIIRDRGTKIQRVENSSSNKSKPASVIWVPKYGRNRRNSIIPSLKELSFVILAQNADAIASLESVPDSLRHKLSQLLCDSRRMNSHCFELLIHGSPTEVRLRDCSWLTEEQFTASFQMCDTSNLMVLQLDQCGRCLSDYVLPSTLARSSNSMPALTTLSLSGACRLSDDGLSKLISSAPVLRSLNISQCSLLTSTSIDTLADSLGSVLRELYLTDCQSIDAMLILPALKKFEQLQVLSLAGIQNVSDDCLREVMTARGHNMKELVLTDCVKLTDSSLKVIAETCPGLCAIDLVNLSKLTDFALGYLANGCHAIQTLKLCRNAFSDEAVAAFLETSGDSLKELSLNNVKKVGHNTAKSLAKPSRRLHTLDLSWCRNLTDEAVGLIVDNCLSLRVLKLFGCTQITDVFLDGHSNPDVQIIGLKMSPVLKHVKVPDHEEGPLHYSLASSRI